MDGLLPEFLAAVKAAGLEPFFAGCTAAHRREYLKWIGAAKLPATRAARIKKAVQMIAANQKSELKKRHQ